MTKQDIVIKRVKFQLQSTTHENCYDVFVTIGVKYIVLLGKSAVAAVNSVFPVDCPKRAVSDVFRAPGGQKRTLCISPILVVKGATLKQHQQSILHLFSITERFPLLSLARKDWDGIPRRREANSSSNLAKATRTSQRRMIGGCQVDYHMSLSLEQKQRKCIEYFAYSATLWIHLAGAPPYLSITASIKVVGLFKKEKKLSAVPNCPLCQIVRGAKLSGAKVSYNRDAF